MISEAVQMVTITIIHSEGVLCCHKIVVAWDQTCCMPWSIKQNDSSSYHGRKGGQQ